MKTITVLLSLIFTTITSFSSELLMNYQFNSTNHTFEVKFNTKTNHNYQVVRFDIVNRWYDCITNYTVLTNQSVVSFTIDPNVISDEDQPTPSGQCWFYLVENPI